MPYKDKAQRNKQANKYYHANKEKYKEYAARRKYGITADIYQSLKSQACFICGKDGQHIDHCHTTGKVRGHLCASCNHGVGLFQDNPVLLVRAAEYVLDNQE